MGLSLSITNDPQRDTVYFECIRPDGVVSAEFRSSFATNQGLSVYFMNNRTDHRPLTISAIEVRYESTSTSPTMTPTVTPSPTLSIVKPTNSTHSATDQEAASNDSILSTTALWKESDSEHSESRNMSPSLYLLIIAVLSAMLCVVTALLILNIARSHRAAKPRSAQSPRREPPLSIADRDGLRILRELESTDTEHDSLYGSGLRTPSKLTQGLHIVVSAQISPFQQH